jgi:hypothetical protein
VDLASGLEDAPAIPPGGLPMRYGVGAEQLQQVPTLVNRPDTAMASRVASAGPIHAVSTRTGEAACGIMADGLEVLDQDWEEAFFVERCPGVSPPSWPMPATRRIALAAYDLLAQALRRSHETCRKSSP